MIRFLRSNTQAENEINLNIQKIEYILLQKNKINKKQINEILSN